jgi:hypothetical protein
MTHRRGVTLALLIGTISVAVVASAAQSPEDAGQAAAESWLRQVDGGDYAGSWQGASKALKGAVSQNEWKGTLEGARTPLGKVTSRRVKSRAYSEKAPTTRVVGGKAYTWGGGGKHVVVEFATAFANNASAEETVIAVQDGDGVWRVSGYSVR